MIEKATEVNVILDCRLPFVSGSMWLEMPLARQIHDSSSQRGCCSLFQGLKTRLVRHGSNTVPLVAGIISCLDHDSCSKSLVWVSRCFLCGWLGGDTRDQDKVRIRLKKNNAPFNHSYMSTSRVSNIDPKILNTLRGHDITLPGLCI